MIASDHDVMIVIDTLPVFESSKSKVVNGAWLRASPIEEREEFVYLSLNVGGVIHTETLRNFIACNYLKRAVSKALLSDETLKKIPLEIMSSNLGSYISTRMMKDINVILDKAGPSLNMKITGCRF